MTIPFAHNDGLELFDFFRQQPHTINAPFAIGDKLPASGIVEDWAHDAIDKPSDADALDLQEHASIVASVAGAAREKCTGLD
jgi:hypothetical protein